MCKIRKKWVKAYRKDSSIIGEFCHEALSEITHGTGGAEVIRSYVSAGSAMASLSVQFTDGWKLHRDWMKCVIAQIAMQGDDSGEMYRHLDRLYAHFGWSLKNSLEPQYDDETHCRP